MKKFLKKPLFWILIAAILFAGYGVFSYVKNSKKSLYQTQIVGRGNVSQEVSVTGRVKPAESVDLAFERSGKVASANLKVGDKVAAGQLLAGLSNTDLAAQVMQAQASLSKEKSKLDEIKAGPRAEDLKIYQTAVDNAQKSLDNAQINLSNAQSKAKTDLDNLYGSVANILNDGYAKADDALNNQLSGLFTNGNSNNPQLTFYTSSQAKSDAEWQKWQATTALVNLKNVVNNLDTGNQDALDKALSSGEDYLSVVRNALNVASAAVSQAGNLSQTAIASYEYSITLGRTNVGAALTSINNQEQIIAAQKITNQNNITSAKNSVDAAKNSLATAQDQLRAQQAGATTDQLKQQQNQIKYAEANLTSAQAQLVKTHILAPIGGTVTRQDAKVGEIANANAIIISLISNAQFEVEVNVPEADIAKVKIGDKAKITLDAYGNNILFSTTVVKIDPAETIIENVATYKTTLQFIQNDERIKSGMTANIDIQTAQKNDVLRVPQRVVITRGNEQFVQVALGNNKTEERKVVVGLKGSDGNIEIISGLREGDNIIILSVK